VKSGVLIVLVISLARWIPNSDFSMMILVFVVFYMAEKSVWKIAWDMSEYLSFCTISVPVSFLRQCCTVYLVFSLGICCFCLVCYLELYYLVCCMKYQCVFLWYDVWVMLICANLFGMNINVFLFGIMFENVLLICYCAVQTLKNYKHL
jgi:hypothetical protein